MSRLAGIIAIVTGDAVGIGLACVFRMAERGAKFVTGAELVVDKGYTAR